MATPRRGPRAVTLRHPEPEDRDAFLAFVAANRRFHRPWVHPPADASAFALYVARARSQTHRGFLVRLRASDEIVGAVNLNEIVRGNLRSAYLGFYGSSAHASRGYMREALGLVLTQAFVRLGLHRVEANVQPANLRSRALIERSGFRKEGFSPRYLKVGGRWRDHERWALLVDEWR